jgi:hypothetical protein
MVSIVGLIKILELRTQWQILLNLGIMGNTHTGKAEILMKFAGVASH